MREFIWEDGFTPYRATLRGDILTEYAGDDIERRSRIVAHPAWDGHPNADAYVMGDGFAAGDVDGVDAVWIDGSGFKLLPVPSGDFDCCAYGDGHAPAPRTCTTPDNCTTDCLFTGVPCGGAR